MVCSNCGYALGPDDQYCGGCGAYLTDPPAEQTGDGPDHWAAAYDQPRQQGPPPRGRNGMLGVILGALAVILVTAVLFVWLGNRGDDDQSATATPTQPASPTATDSPTQAPTTEPPTETSPPATPTAEPTRIELPGSATQCNNVAGMAVFRGNDQTSCQFAENVARAFGDLDQPVTAAVTLEDVASPITGQSYDLACDFSTPVRCTGGNNAVIYLSPSS